MIAFSSRAFLNHVYKLISEDGNRVVGELMYNEFEKVFPQRAQDIISTEHDPYHNETGEELGRFLKYLTSIDGVSVEVEVDN